MERVKDGPTERQVSTMSQLSSVMVDPIECHADLGTWEKVLENIDQYSTDGQFKPTSQMIECCWSRGLPETRRADLWKALSGSEQQASASMYLGGENEEDEGCADTPLFGCDWYHPQEHNVLTQAGLRSYEKVLRGFAYANPAMQYAPWVPMLASCCLRIMSEEETLLVLLSTTRNKIASSKLESWEMVFVLDCLAKQVCPDVRKKVLVENKYGELIYYPDGSMVVNIKKQPDLGSSRHPFAGISFEWIGTLRAEVMIWVFDNFFVQGMPALYHVGIGMLCLWDTQSSTSTLSIAEMAATISSHQLLTQQKLYTITSIRSASFGKWKTQAQFPCQKAVGLTGRSLASTEIGRHHGINRAAPQNVVGNRVAHMVGDSEVVDSNDLNAMKQVWESIPIRYHHITPRCIFTTSIDGCSLQTLYERCEDHFPTILVIRSSRDAVFGAYLSHPLSDRFGEHYFGSGETFVFQIRPKCQIFTWGGRCEDDEFVPATPLVHTFCPAISRLAHLSLVIGMAPITADADASEPLKRESLRIASGMRTGFATEDAPNRNISRQGSRVSRISSLKRRLSKSPTDPTQPKRAPSRIGSQKRLSLKRRKSFGIASTNILPETSTASSSKGRFFIRGTMRRLYIGGGGGSGHAIELDDELKYGDSAEAATFNNCQLAGDDKEFECQTIEVWALNSACSDPGRITSTGSTSPPDMIGIRSGYAVRGSVPGRTRIPSGEDPVRKLSIVEEVAVATVRRMETTLPATPARDSTATATRRRSPQSSPITTPPGSGAPNSYPEQSSGKSPQKYRSKMLMRNSSTTTLV